MNTIILTAAVNPSCFVTINDPNIRKQEYIRAMSRWIIESPFNHIIFAESSGTPILNDYLKLLAEKLNKELTELVFDFSHITKQYGKGRSEAYLVEEAVNLVKTDVFYKCTGRLFIKNCSSIISNTKDPVVFIELLPKIPNECITDTRFWKSTKEYYYTVLDKLKNEIDDGIAISNNNNRMRWIERIYPQVGCFSEHPFFCGKSGSNGWVYDEPL